MVVSSRPQWAKSGSWRNYIRTSSRKLLIQQQNDSLQSDLTQERHVQFDTTPTANVVIITREEPSVMEARWYKKSDYELFERDRQLTALQYRTVKKNGRPFIEREHTVRGLEELLDMEDDTKNGARIKERAAHLRVVLEEQERQRTEAGYPNDTMLREISCKSSRDARKRSASVAEADALGGHVSSSRALQRQMSGVMHNISRKMNDLSNH